jgi:outer membrane biosynthesis protein TonB
MSESVEVAEVAQETTEAAVEEKKPEEATATEAQAVEEVPTVETVEEKKEEEPIMPELSREEFTRIADRFGNDIAVRCMREGKDFSTALTWHVEALETENKSLKEKVSVLSATSSTTGKPVAMCATVKPQAKLFNTGK